MLHLIHLRAAEYFVVAVKYIYVTDIMEQCATRSVKATNPSSKKGLSITSPGIVMGKVWVVSRCVMEVGDMKGRPVLSNSGQAASGLNCLSIAMYSSYTSILLVVGTHCCLHSRSQQAEVGRAGTSRQPALDTYSPRLVKAK
jgi:hypothetical protein